MFFMDSEILSFKDAMKYVPTKKSLGIRIYDGFQFLLPNLEESPNWVKINKYCFDDQWPGNWAEYPWLDFNSEYFEKIAGGPWTALQGQHPKMTEESYRGYLESRGQFEDRPILFNEDIAKKILNDYEKVEGDIEGVVIHCNDGLYRGPAVEIAMNEIYGWGIDGLKDKFPLYRKFVYDILKSVE